VGDGQAPQRREDVSALLRDGGVSEELNLGALVGAIEDVEHDGFAVEQPEVVAWQAQR
jgi:hypothetical protein